MWATAKTSVFILREEGSALLLKEPRDKRATAGRVICEKAIWRRPGCDGPARVGRGSDTLRMITMSMRLMRGSYESVVCKS